MNRRDRRRSRENGKINFKDVELIEHHDAKLDQKRKIKVCMAFISKEYVMAWTACSLMELFHYSVVSGIDMSYINPHVARIETGRTIAVRAAQTMNADYLLFIDSDMTFPRDGIVRMINRNVDILGCNAAKRHIPFEPAIRLNIDNEPLDFQGKEIEEVRYVGNAFTLVKMSVYEKMSKPYYSAEYNSDSDSFYGEDYFFCRKARKSGFKIYCDNKLSFEIGHVSVNPLYIPRDFSLDKADPELKEKFKKEANIFKDLRDKQSQ